MEKKLVRDLIIFPADILLIGTASGKWVEAHMMVSKYWLPLLVLGSGPTQSEDSAEGFLKGGNWV